MSYINMIYILIKKNAKFFKMKLNISDILCSSREQQIQKVIIKSRGHKENGTPIKHWRYTTIPRAHYILLYIYPSFLTDVSTTVCEFLQ